MRDPNADYPDLTGNVYLNDAQPERPRRGDIDLVALMEPVVRRLRGEPNPSFTKKDELRWGTHGSLSVDLKKGTWYDFEDKIGGNCVAFIRREVSGVEPMKWLRQQKLIPDDPIVGRFNYTDEQSAILYQVCRTAAKSIWAQRPNGHGGWLAYKGVMKDVRRVLYRLPELLARPDDIVLLPEGEPKVDLLVQLGFCATCNYGGSGKWVKAYSESLRGRDVVILPDNDKAGEAHTQKVARYLTGVARRVRVLYLPGLKPKGDVKNWLADGGTKEELLRLIEACPTWEETQPGSPEDGGNYERDDSVVPYYVRNGGIYWDKPTAQGSPIPVRLSNFTAQITAEVKLDDGSGHIEGRYTIKGSLGQAEVSLEKFPSLTWVERWGRRAIINPGHQHNAFLANAIKTLSPDAIDKTVYTHLGWREINGQLVYLHAGGAIGANGPVDGIEVNPGNSTLDKFILPPVTDIQAALRCSLSLLDVAPAHIVYPLWGAIYRAPLAYFAPMTVTVWVVGPTGVHKTSLTLIGQAHYAPSISKATSANWSSTANANERLAFQAKDVLLLVDDFAPRGNPGDVARIHAAAERLIRAQANQAGRLRMNADATLKKEMYPRGGLLGTGEDIPRGHSLRARMMVVEMMKGDVDLALLTALQDCAAYGLPAEAMSGYVSWVARQPNHGWAARREIELRAEATGPHARVAENAACLMVGVESGLRFAVEMGVLDDRGAKEHWKLAWATLKELATAQEVYLRSESPVERFFTLLQSILSSGRAHIAAMNGDEPARYRDALGWVPASRMSDGKLIYRGAGNRIGWVDGGLVYLLPDATYSELQNFASSQNAAMEVTQETLWKRLDESGRLAQKEEGRTTLKKRIAGQRPRVLCLNLKTVVGDEEPTQTELPLDASGPE